MTKTVLFSVAIFAASSLSSSAFAQSSQNLPMHGGMPDHHNTPMHSTMQQSTNEPSFTSPAMPPRPAFADFPTPDELARMVPPEPLTEELIKQRFAKQKETLQKAIDRDRKQAEQYARDFARYQKFQAEQLAKMMEQAEKHREQLIKRLEQREQHMLETFRQRSDKSAEPLDPK